MDTIREFMVSSSGLAPARRGLGLGWVISVLSGVAILLGAREAEANPCSNWYDCKFKDSCPPKTPIECCYTERALNTQTGRCETVSVDCVCTL